MNKIFGTSEEIGIGVNPGYGGYHRKTYIDHVVSVARYRSKRFEEEVWITRKRFLIMNDESLEFPVNLI